MTEAYWRRFCEAQRAYRYFEQFNESSIKRSLKRTVRLWARMYALAFWGETKTTKAYMCPGA